MCNAIKVSLALFIFVGIYFLIYISLAKLIKKRADLKARAEYARIVHEHEQRVRREKLEKLNSTPTWAPGELEKCRSMNNNKIEVIEVPFSGIDFSPSTDFPSSCDSSSSSNCD